MVGRAATWRERLKDFARTTRRAQTLGWKQTPVRSPHTAVQLHWPMMHSQAPVTQLVHIGLVVQSVSQPSGAGLGQPGAAQTLAQQVGSPGGQPGAHTSPG